MSQLRAFLGVANFFRSFVPHFAQLAEPLTALTRKGAKFTWTSAEEAAFDSLKAACLDCAVLSFPDPDFPLMLQTYASTVGIGAVLLQADPKKPVAPPRPIAFLSRKFNSTQQRWSTIEREAYAIWYAVTTWDTFLPGRPFTVQTDHRNLQLRYNSTTPKVLRWRLALEGYEVNQVDTAVARNERIASIVIVRSTDMCP